MGPPLEVTFKEEISEEGADQAVKIYRDYYETKGQLEAHLYDGIKRFSSTLVKDPNKKIYITTSKNEPYCSRNVASTLASLSFLTHLWGHYLLLSTRLIPFFMYMRKALQPSEKAEKFHSSFCS